VVFNTNVTADSLDLADSAILTVNSSAIFGVHAVSLHSGSIVHANGTFGNADMACHSHNPSNAGSGTTPNIDGNGSFRSISLPGSVSEILSNCTQDNLP
jgi:hypothetical protein